MLWSKSTRPLAGQALFAGRLDGSPRGFRDHRGSCVRLDRFIQLRLCHPKAIGARFRFVGQLDKHGFGLRVNMDNADRKKIVIPNLRKEIAFDADEVPPIVKVAQAGKCFRWS